MDSPTEAELRLTAALAVAVLALDLIEKETVRTPVETARAVLYHLKERYGVRTDDTT
jgi:hypothetical protein